MAINLDEIIGLCRLCGGSLGESPPPTCANCERQESRRTTKIKERDPYKKVWNSVEDEEAELLSWVKNGTLFVPTREELAKRHIAHARYLLSRARYFGRSTEGTSVFNEAMFHRRMARKLLEQHAEIVLKSK
jgi:hypothetical protein